MAKRTQALTFQAWLNLATKDLFLGRFSLFTLSNSGSLERDHETAGEWAEQNSGEKESTNVEAYRSFIDSYRKANGKV